MISKLMSRVSTGFNQLITRMVILLAKLSLVILFCGLVSFGWAWFLYQNQLLNPIFYKAVVVIGVGIGTGIIARIVFIKNKFLLAWLSATLSMVISLGWLNGITAGRSGFLLFGANTQATNWDGLWQLGLGMILAWVVLSAWKPNRIRAASESGGSARRPAPEAYPQEASLHLPIRSKKPSKTDGLTRRAVSGIKRPIKDKAKISLGHYGGLANKAQEGILAMVKSVQPKTKKKAELQIGRGLAAAKLVKKRSANHPSLSLGRAKFKAPSNPIRLMGAEEHRCPYCLDLVDPQDPAGVVICSVCHTYHHKSCWDVTGTCQVPHIHE